MSDIFVNTDGSRFAIRIAIALLCGTALGVERQWRGRQAGLRTNLLVCVGSAIFTYLSATAFGTATDKSRIAAQIVSGVGFLGAGVVLRRGESVQGLNTAATLWTAAAVGMAAGIGAVDVALEASFAILIVQVLFRPLAGWVDRRTVRAAPRYRYWLTAIVDAPAAQEVQDIVLSTLADRAIERISTHMHVGDAGDVSIEFVLSSPAREVGALESLFPDLMRLSGMRDLAWRSETEAARAQLLRRRTGTRALIIHDDGGNG